MYILKLEQQHPSIQDIITLPIDPIINGYFNKHPMSWEIIRRRLLHPSDSIMKAMFRHQTLDVLPKHFPNKIHKSLCIISYIEKMTTINKVTTVDTSNLRPV